MPGTRSSKRHAAGASSSPTSSQGTPTANASSAGAKRKGDATAGPKSKRGRPPKNKEQTTIEATMPIEANGNDSKDVEMKDSEISETLDDKEALEAVEAAESKETNEKSAHDELEAREQAVTARENAVKENEVSKNENVDPENRDEEVTGHDKLDDEKHGDTSKLDETDKIEPASTADAGDKGDISVAGDAVEESPKREDSTPSSILEKGIIYFFFRGRVGIDEPSQVGDVARSYIVLRPIPHGSKLGDGPIGDAGTNRLLALPKKVLPDGPKDRFMVFVEKAKASMEDIKSTFSSTDYDTKTAGSRHTPAAAPIGEGVYAFTTTGRDSHLAYILTIPSEISEVQKDIGLQERGSFVVSAKNPQYSGPANTNLPQGPDFPQE